MKFVKQTLLAAALVGTVGSAMAGWGTNYFQGFVKPDGGTKVVGDKQAGNTWDDWVWRGKWDGTVFYCHPNSGGCVQNWGISKTTSYSHTTGWSIGGGFGFEKGAINGEIQGVYQNAKTWGESQTESFNWSTNVAAGKWAQPVIVAVRRWRNGHFNGGHFYTGTANGWPYWYEWAWNNFGSWQGNEKEWGYKMIQVANSSNQL